MISGSCDLFYFSQNKFFKEFFFLLHIFMFNAFIFKDNRDLSFVTHITNEILYS